MTFCSQSTLKVSIQSKMFFSLVLSLTQIYSKKSVTFFPPALLSNCSCIIFYFFTFSFTVALQLEWPAARQTRSISFFLFFFSLAQSPSKSGLPPALTNALYFRRHSGRAPARSSKAEKVLPSPTPPPSHATNSLPLCRPPTSFRRYTFLFFLPLMPRTHWRSVDHRPHFARAHTQAHTHT